MNRHLRGVLLHAAEIIEQYAAELRRSNVVNGSWKGAGVTKIRDEWADMLKTARTLRDAGGAK